MTSEERLLVIGVAALGLTMGVCAALPYPGSEDAAAAPAGTGEGSPGVASPNTDLLPPGGTTRTRTLVEARALHH